MKNEALTLYEQWTSLDDRVLMKNPVSFRLPVHIMARLNAMADVFPARSRTDVMVDLLKEALAHFEEKVLPVDDSPEMKASGKPSLEFVVGMTYRAQANKHYKALAKDIGVDSVPELFPLKAKGKKHGK